MNRSKFSFLFEGLLATSLIGVGIFANAVSAEQHSARSAENRMYAAVAPRQLRGTYTIQQKSNRRYVDAHEGPNNDYRLVTRKKQGDDTQRWIISPVGRNEYTIQQRSNYRYVDAHEYAGQDYRLVTRPKQNNNTQRWIITPVGRGEYTIQQRSNMRYVDAHSGSGEDYGVVTRTRQKNDTQRWIITRT